MYFPDFRHAFPACNELRQVRAMMSRDFKSNSSLAAQKTHLITDFPIIISSENLLKILAKKQKDRTFRQNRTFSNLFFVH